MTPLVRLSVEVDRDALIDACLAFVAHPRDPQRRATLVGGLIPIDLLEVLALLIPAECAKARSRHGECSRG